MQSSTAGEALAARAEVLKWIGLAAMLADHVDAWLLERSAPALYAAGRLALPLFALSLALGVAASRKYEAICGKLLAWGAATLLAQLLVRDLLPLNVLFTLFGGVYLALAFLDPTRSKLSALVVAVALSPFVEFGAYGILFAAAATWWAHRRDTLSESVVLLALVLLYIPNGNHWALLAVVPVLLIEQLPVVPRLRGFFYRVYLGQHIAFGVVRAFL